MPRRLNVKNVGDYSIQRARWSGRSRQPPRDWAEGRRPARRGRPARPSYEGEYGQRQRRRGGRYGAAYDSGYGPRRRPRRGRYEGAWRGPRPRGRRRDGPVRRAEPPVYEREYHHGYSRGRHGYGHRIRRYSEISHYTPERPDTGRGARRRARAERRPRRLRRHDRRPDAGYGREYRRGYGGVYGRTAF